MHAIYDIPNRSESKKFIKCIVLFEESATILLKEYILSITLLYFQTQLANLEAIILASRFAIFIFRNQLISQTYLPSTKLLHFKPHLLFFENPRFYYIRTQKIYVTY